MKFGVLPDVHLGRPRVLINLWDIFLPRSPWEIAGEEIDKRLEAFVKKVNTSPDIEFVFSVGDLTESATRPQICRIKEILRNLEKPWVPLMGNHDVWPYKRAPKGKVLWHAPEPIKFIEFKEHFREEFAHVSWCFQNWQEQGELFQNISFVYSNVKFIVVDNVTRMRAPLGFQSGTAPWSQFHKASRGWLKEQIEGSGEIVGIVVISHGPLRLYSLRKILSGLKVWVMAISGHTHKFTIKKVKKKEKTLFFVTSNALYVTPEFPVVTLSNTGPEITLHTI